MIILPRQARDKHRKNSKKRRFLAAQQAGHDANPDQNSLAPAAAAAATALAGGAQLGVQVYQCFVDERIGDGRRVTASR